MYSISIEAVSANIFAIMLLYIYTGSVRCRSEQVSELLAAADRFVIPGLKQRCEEMMIKVFHFFSLAFRLSKGITESNMFDLAEFAQNFFAPKLLQACFEQFVEHNLKPENLEKTGELGAELLQTFREFSNDTSTRDPYHMGPTVNPSRRTRRNRNFIRLPAQSRIPHRPHPVIANVQRPVPGRIENALSWIRRNVINDNEYKLNLKLDVPGWVTLLTGGIFGLLLLSVFVYFIYCFSVYVVPNYKGAVGL